jgi:DNA-binding CsgD family transcriptional regulator
MASVTRAFEAPDLSEPETESDAARLQLFGRASEQRQLEALVEELPQHGGAVLVSGEPGIGKSALVASARAFAAARGMRVLTVTGVEPEAKLAFAGLHQLLQPVLGHVGQLAPPQREAMLAAFGKTEAVAPDLFLIALGALELIAEAAATGPVLVIAEDAHWLDRSTADVLAFIARRVEYEPVLVLIATRSGFESSFAAVGLTQLQLQPLAADAAAALLDSREPDLAAAFRDQVLNMAGGNPLALVELPLAVRQLGEQQHRPREMALTARLERAFAARLSELPEATRALLLVAAVNDAPALGEALDATEVLLGTELALDLIDLAVSAQLVRTDGREVEFRHPLIRTAIQQEASLSQRHAAHAALAGVLRNEPDRAVWHRFAAATGPDETVALELEELAARAERRGAVAAAMDRLEQAAQLSADPVVRSQRLLRAAELGFELGRIDAVQRLLATAGELDLSRLDRARLEWLREIFFDGAAGDSMRVRELIAIAAESAAAGELELAVNLLFGAAMRCFWADQGDAVGERVADQASRLQLPESDPRRLAILACSAPASRRRAVLAQLDEVPPNEVASPYDARLLGIAAQASADFTTARKYFRRASAGLRDQGRLGLLAQVLVCESWGEISRANWDVALPIAREAAQMARETGQPIWTASPLIGCALIEGARGATDRARELVIEAQRTVDMTQQGLLSSLLHLAQGVIELSTGAFGEACDHLQRLFDPTDPSYPYRSRYRAISYYAEAAIHVQRADEARSALDDLQRRPPRDAGTPADSAQVHAQALLADARGAEAVFSDALAAVSPSEPFELARVRLSYGTWLRRQRRMADSRPPLRQARDAFDALGATPWSERARQELRASGETSRRRVASAREELTPQELQIARLAASGLTNREIGQMLYLSHRTIGSHLYKVFPKVRVTSRAELRDALDAEPADDS